MTQEMKWTGNGDRKWDIGLLLLLLLLFRPPHNKFYFPLQNKKENDSPLQKDNADDAEARRRKEVAEAKAEAEKKAAAEIKKVTDTMEAKTKEAVAEATAKAVKETEEKLRLSFTTRKWPVNISVPKEASKLACTEESLGRMAFRENNFFGCKTHCVDVCNQCNCRQEESVVADPDCGGCEKRYFLERTYYS